MTLHLAVSCIDVVRQTKTKSENVEQSIIDDQWSVDDNKIISEVVDWFLRV